MYNMFWSMYTVENKVNWLAYTLAHIFIYFLNSLIKSLIMRCVIIKLLMNTHECGIF